MLKNFNRVLYITYDGLSDPLGGSQIIPYLSGISEYSNIWVISFEKKNRVIKVKKKIQKIFKEKNIGWVSLNFTGNFGKTGKAWDLLKMYFISFFLVLTKKIQIIHGRGHAQSQVGLIMKKLFKLKLIFDLRGLWADERIDNGAWNLDNKIDKIVYDYFKKVEIKLLQESDEIIVLTKAVCNELVQLSHKKTLPITIIPCCADFEHFKIKKKFSDKNIKENLRISEDALIISYLGSLGGVYMLKDMLNFFLKINKYNKNSYFLFITYDQKILLKTLKEQKYSDLANIVRAVSIFRDEVPDYLGISDIMLSFVRPTYARKASFPTKIAEAFAMGIPCICNKGVGDIDEIVKSLDAGKLVNLDDETELIATAKSIGLIKQQGGQILRDKARKKLGLEIAQIRYKEVYKKINDNFSKNKY